MSFYIEKQFEAAVAHRVHNQYLCDSLRDNCSRTNPCRNIHGHTALFTVGLTSQSLINDMVIDFNMIGFVKKALDQHYDHRFTLCINDPFYQFAIQHAYACLACFAQTDQTDKMIPLKLNTIEELDGGEQFRCYTVNIPENYRKTNHHLVQWLDSFTITNFTTTSENLAHWMYNVVVKHLNEFADTTTDPEIKHILQNMSVKSVSYKESPKSIAVYSE